MWSPDGKRIAFYESTVEETWGARRPERIALVSSQIVSVDVATGARTVHTSGPGFKVFPQYLDDTTIAYLKKGVIAVPAGAVKGAPRRLVKDVRPEKSGRWVNVRGLDNSSARALLEHVAQKASQS